MATQRRGVCVKDVDATEFVMAYAKHLKRTNKVKLPEWVDMVKTAKWKELAPKDDDWFYIRMASMARKLYLRGGVGVGAFRKIYGGAGNSGSKPSHFEPCAGGVIRHCLKQLAELKVIEKHPSGGRRLTKDGQRDLDRVAGSIIAAKAQ